ncbi:hypothetical protein Ae706Ps2_6694 [Pseudonocardia sp. Ae706_Ps2]|nr:hypothetical protein Ae706Ps2_6694 [Pseudonocardia sp. Ae706_Ps2]
MLHPDPARPIHPRRRRTRRRPRPLRTRTGRPHRMGHGRPRPGTVETREPPRHEDPDRPLRNRTGHLRHQRRPPRRPSEAPAHQHCRRGSDQPQHHQQPGGRQRARTQRRAPHRIRWRQWNIDK